MFTIEAGPVARPIIVLLYGAPGVGKTHLASGFKRALVCDLEDGSDFLNVKRIKPKSHSDLLKVFKWFAEQPEFDTLILDSLTAIEKVTNAHTLAANGWESLEDPGYGKGYAAARQNLGRIISGCEYLRNNGKNVVIVGHSKVKNVTDPTQDSYERMEFDVDKNMISPIVSVVDACFYMRPQVRSVENKDKERRTVGNGTRELLLTDRGSAISKNRFNHMPPLVEFPSEPDPAKLSQQYTAFWNQLISVPKQVTGA